MLDKSSKLPLYIQLKNELIDLMKTGVLRRGGIVPTEQELCARYDISRFPVRQAMEELVNEGYLKRVRGRGTFINEKLPESVFTLKRNLLGLVMGSLTPGLCGQILEGMKEGIIAAKIAAHAADLAKGVSNADKWDHEMSQARWELDWEKMFTLAMDSEKAKRYRSESIPEDGSTCTMCGKMCAIKNMNKVIQGDAEGSS